MRAAARCVKRRLLCPAERATLRRREEKVRMRGRLRIGDDQVVELADMFRLMSDPTRLRIILACLDAPAAVGEMAERLGISPSLVSHHLRLLRAARQLG